MFIPVKLNGALLYMFKSDLQHQVLENKQSDLIVDVDRVPPGLCAFIIYIDSQQTFVCIVIPLLFCRFQGRRPHINAEGIIKLNSPNWISKGIRTQSIRTPITN